MTWIHDPVYEYGLWYADRSRPQVMVAMLPKRFPDAEWVAGPRLVASEDGEHFAWCATTREPLDPAALQALCDEVLEG